MIKLMIAVFIIVIVVISFASIKIRDNFDKLTGKGIFNINLSICNY